MSNTVVFVVTNAVHVFVSGAITTANAECVFNVAVAIAGSVSNAVASTHATLICVLTWQVGIVIIVACRQICAVVCVITLAITIAVVFETLTVGCAGTSVCRIDAQINVAHCGGRVVVASCREETALTRAVVTSANTAIVENISVTIAGSVWKAWSSLFAIAVSAFVGEVAAVDGLQIRVGIVVACRRIHTSNNLFKKLALERSWTIKWCQVFLSGLTISFWKNLVIELSLDVSGRSDLQHKDAKISSLRRGVSRCVEDIPRCPDLGVAQQRSRTVSEEERRDWLITIFHNRWIGCACNSR